MYLLRLVEEVPIAALELEVLSHEDPILLVLVMSIAGLIAKATGVRCKAKQVVCRLELYEALLVLT